MSIAQEPVRAELERQLKAKPLVDGQTDEVDAKALVNNRTIIQEPRQVIEVPYRAAYCEVKSVPRRIERQVKVGRKSFECLVAPWKWGTCWKDVYETVVETVYDEVKECFPERLEVVKTIFTPVVHLKEAILPTKIRLRYRVDLESLGLSMSGSELTLKPKLRSYIDADLRQGVLGSSVLIRGALHCESVLVPEVKTNLSFRQEAADIKLAAEVSAASLDVQQLCLCDAIQGIDLSMLTDPEGRGRPALRHAGRQAGGDGAGRAG